MTTAKEIGSRPHVIIVGGRDFGTRHDPPWRVFVCGDDPAAYAFAAPTSSTVSVTPANAAIAASAASDSQPTRPGDIGTGFGKFPLLHCRQRVVLEYGNRLSSCRSE